jgi:hypothetical protein
LSAICAFKIRIQPDININVQVSLSKALAILSGFNATGISETEFPKLIKFPIS